MLFGNPLQNSIIYINKVLFSFKLKYKFVGVIGNYYLPSFRIKQITKYCLKLKHRGV